VYCPLGAKPRNIQVMVRGKPSTAVFVPQTQNIVADLKGVAALVVV
jgi:hypothetical protein